MNQRESSAGLGGGGNALARWTSGTSTDVAAALAMSRLRDKDGHSSDVGPELLTWIMADDDRELPKIREAICTHLVAWAEQHEVRTRKPEALADAIAVATMASMSSVRHPRFDDTGTQRKGQSMGAGLVRPPRAADAAKAVGVSKATFLDLKAAGVSFIRNELQRAREAFLVALGAREPGLPSNRYVEIMDKPDRHIPAVSLSEFESQVRETLAVRTISDFRTDVRTVRAAFEHELRKKLGEMLTRATVAYLNAGMASLLPWRVTTDAFGNNSLELYFDVSRSYAAESIALIAGVGLCYATRETEPVHEHDPDAALAAGWELSVPLISGVDFKEDNTHPAYVTMRVTTTLQTFTVEQRIRLPGEAYLGDFEAGKRYEHGDVVFFEGDLWLAQRDTSAQPGSTGPVRADWMSYSPPTASESSASLPGAAA